jgi:hypothetical protein
MREGANCERDIFVEIKISSTDSARILIEAILFDAVVHK